MGTFIIIAIVALIAGWVVWQRNIAAKALEGVSFTVAAPPDAVVSAITTMYCVGAKAKLRSKTARLEIDPAGRTSFSYRTKIGDRGSISIRPQGSGSLVEARTDEISIGSHPATQFRRGIMGISSSIVHGFCKACGVAPGASHTKRFQDKLESKVLRQLGRSA